MKIVELKGDKTVQALAKRLVKENHSKVSANELVATLLRLNPQLNDIVRLGEGTPILIPPQIAPAGEKTTPGAGLVGDLVETATRSVQELRTAFRESLAHVGEESEQAQAWLKGEQAARILHELPELREEFAKTADGAKDVANEQSAQLAGQEKALRKVQAELAEFQKSL